jgi:DNA polymerase III subunit epsilon
MLVVERRYKIINWRSWVHGPTAAFLADKPLFGDVACELLAFVGDASLVAHNAGFNIAFLNAELKRAAIPVIAPERVVDTLVLAWRKHPGGHNTLDDLYARCGVDRSRRPQHGALLDAELRAAVYVDRTTTAKPRCSLSRARRGRQTFTQSSGRGSIHCRRA